MKTTIEKPKTRRGRAVPRRTNGPSRISTSALEKVPSLQIRSILVPIDFSEPCRKALTYAVRLAEHFGAKLTLLHVVEPVAMPDFVKSFPLAMENEKVVAACKTKLDELAREQSIDPRFVPTTLVRDGRSFDEITAAARTLKVDLIIISTHGYTGLKHAILGSTTERVVRYAPCPVLVVREQEHEFVT